MGFINEVDGDAEKEGVGNQNIQRHDWMANQWLA